MATGVLYWPHILGWYLRTLNRACYFPRCTTIVFPWRLLRTRLRHWRSLRLRMSPPPLGWTVQVERWHLATTTVMVGSIFTAGMINCGAMIKANFPVLPLRRWQAQAFGLITITMAIWICTVLIPIACSIMSMVLHLKSKACHLPPMGTGAEPHGVILTMMALLICMAVVTRFRNINLTSSF